MSPAFRHGKNTAVYFDVTDFSPFLNAGTETAQVDTAETSAYGSTGKTFVTGLDAGTVSMAGMFSGIAGDIEPVLTAAIASATDNILTFAFDGGAPATNGNGRRCGLGAVQQTSLVITAPISGMVSLSFDAQLDGGADNGRLLWTPASTAVTGTGPIFYTTGEDLGTAQTNGAVAHLHVLSPNSLNQTITVKIQHSATAGGAYADLGTPMAFTTVGIGATSSQRITSVLTNIQQFVRAHITLGGVATGAALVVVSFAKR